MLHGAADAAGDVELGAHRGAGLTDLVLVAHPARVHGGAAGADDAADGAGQLFDQGEAFTRADAHAARDDRQGVLILSPFTGAAREMPEALLVNPYATDAFADALNTALTMPVEEQRRRMQRLRTQVSEHNIFRWAGLLLSETFRLAESTK